MHLSLRLPVRTSLGILAVAGLCIFLAVPAEAQTMRSMIQSKSDRAMASSSPAVSCMSTAVNVREATLIAGFTTYSASLLTALENRKEALTDAWDMTDGKARNAAFRTAWKNWRTENLAAHKSFRADRKLAWETFKKTAKSTCQVTVPKEEGLEKVQADTITL